MLVYNMSGKPDKFIAVQEPGAKRGNQMLPSASIQYNAVAEAVLQISKPGSISAWPKL